MRLGVVIERKNHYRLLGPVVDAALGRGWEVFCWHDYAQPRYRGKWYEFPAIEAVPRFQNGSPRVEVYRGRDELRGFVPKVDAVLSLIPVPETVLEADGASGAKWIVLQYHALLTSSLQTPGVLSAGLVGFYSPWWLEFGLRHLRARGLSAPDDAVEREIRRKAVFVGFPELDQIPAIDAAAVCRRWGIPDGKPVVVFLPYPFRLNPRTPWSRWVYPPGNPAWKRMRLRLAGERRLEPLVARGWDDLAVIRAVRTFCEASGAYLLVKARLKDPVPGYLQRVADLVLYDETYYPPTILEALGVASLCVHFYSAAVLEAVACGVPSLSICPILEDMGVGYDWERWFYTREEGGLFQFRGTAETMGIGEAIEKLPRMSLADFGADPAAREAYAAKFLGRSDGKSTGRLLDAVDRAMGGAS